MIDDKFLDEIGRLVGAKRDEVAGAAALLDKGATVSFIARYRKDATGNLGEERLEEIGTLNTRFVALTNRREAILENIEKQGKLTDTLRAKIGACMDHSLLEDIYGPFKKSQRTKGALAIEQGLGGLADIIWEQSLGSSTLEEIAGTFLEESKLVADVGDALEGVVAILAERIAQDDNAPSLLRAEMLKNGKIVSVATKNTEGRKTRFEAYYKFSGSLRRIAAHDLLALFRGVRQGFLRMDLVVDEAALMAALEKIFVKDADSPLASLMLAALSDSFTRLLRPMIEAELLENARRQAEEDVVAAFRRSATALLMAPPAGEVVVLGVSAASNGCCVAVVDAAGAFVESAALEFSAESESASADLLLALLSKHDVRYIAISHGGGPRTVSNFIKGVLKARSVEGIPTVIVNSAGASSYGTSPLATTEFPEASTSIREAIFTGRRLQNPLATLVQLDPRVIGVGHAQHDVNPRYLRDSLHRTIEMCVNRVAVDVNNAPAEVLRYVSGIQMATAKNIVAYRTEHGPFTSREQLREVAGIGGKTYEQCVGFLRIPEATNPLDATGIHPESYGVVARIAEAGGTTVPELLGNRAVLREVDFASYAEEGLGTLGLGEIRRELMSPGADPRGAFKVAKFADGLERVEDLKVGMELEGVVTNVTDFGAFLDVGLPQDGLIHLSEMVNRFVRDPRNVVRIGQIVRVRVVKVDVASQRLSFSMKLGEKGPARQGTDATGGDTPRRARSGATVPRDASQKSREAATQKVRRKPKSKPKTKERAKGPMTFGSDEVFGGSMADQLERFKDRLG